MDRIVFKVNGEEFSVGNDVSSDVMLLDYLRTRLKLHGTKYMCREGGCGACIVAASPGPGESPRAVNSCLVSVTSCHKWEITTVEKLGDKLNGYHPIQTTLAENHGSQCGYCSPGWVMAMYSLLQSKKDLTMLDIEKSFGSNLCRCTGYRPILKAFKQFAKDAPNSLLYDIEDLEICKKTNRPCTRTCSDSDWCFISKGDNVTQDTTIKITLQDGKKWYKVYTAGDIFTILQSEGDDSYMLVSGNTSKGVYPIMEYPRILIDISSVTELQGYKIDQNLMIGGNTTLSATLDIFQTVSQQENFLYLQKLFDHINLVAHIPVRNLGSIAGNLMTKNKYKSFPSDIFLLLTTVGANVTIMSAQGIKQTITMQEFLNTDMKSKIIYNVLLPPLGSDYKIVTFKIMPRSQSALAIVNSGFLYRLNVDNTLQSARIVFGGISPTFVRASQTEQYLIGKPLFDNNTLQGALNLLNVELDPADFPEFPAAYRKQLALALFYKGLLTLCPEEKLGAQYRSGVKRLHESRPVSQATQEFGTNPSIYPLNQPIQKVDALIQCAGETVYTDDVPTLKNEVFSALVLSTVALGDIDSIDASEALKLPGVIAFYSAKDIPGKNSFMMFGAIVFVDDEEVFCSKNVKYYNQPLGIVVATTTPIAERAAKLVKVTYSNLKKPVIDIKDTKMDQNRVKLFLQIPPLGRGILVDKVFKNNYTIYGQYHIPMETIVCASRPTEQGIAVYASTQWMDSLQYVVAKALQIDANGVDVYVNRLGGGFGLKITRSNLAAVACSLASVKLNRPCRLIQSMPSVTRALGKRLPCSTDVEVGISRNGTVQYMKYDLYCDNGYIVSELASTIGVDAHNNCYQRIWWNYRCFNATTDNARNAYCRSPSTLENIAMAETIMEQISYEQSLDPYDVRITNLDRILHSDIKTLGETLKIRGQYDSRRAVVDKYNSENRWKKRGLRWSFLRYTPISPVAFAVNLSVCHGDGSVIINHAGIELGQGINTKAIQIAAYLLKIPISKIKVKGANTITAPNSLLTGSSITSQCIGMGVERCCKELLLRLAPIKIILLNPSWEKLIETAHKAKINLQVYTFVNDLIAPPIVVYGVTLAEVEVDILTGESEIVRVDLLEDVGRSVSPQIDVGQVEGAFIMGVGYWTCEKLVYEKDTGELLSDRTWNYHIPQARDIPQDFRVYFRENSFSADIVLGSKVTGEPATCMAICIPFAMREAVSSARKDAGIPTTEWFKIDGPFTTEKLCMSAATKLEYFKLY